MKVIVAGSRNITDYDTVATAIKESTFRITQLVSGCARGVDMEGERWAAINDVPIKHFPADWDTHGKQAGRLRNSKWLNMLMPSLLSGMASLQVQKI